MTLERTRYFSGQLLSPEDPAQDQQYFRERARRHNLAFHGWGVVCGVTLAEVVLGSDLEVATVDAGVQRRRIK